MPMICEKINPLHNLKSNMDRFIEEKAKKQVIDVPDLKSNMDRFIVIPANICPNLDTFKIQYG